MGRGPAEDRWRQEAEFFDQWAAKRTRIAELGERVVGRYRSPGRLFPKEYACRLLGDLEGRTVLDLGCGEGENSVLLARLGATVTGIDISPKAIEAARERARANGVADRTSFVCAPAEEAHLPNDHFDVIWGDNVLHHLLPVLDATLETLVRAAKPGAQVVFIEPTNLNPTLRRIRFLVPVHTEATPGERPLEQGDLAVFENHVGQAKRRHFGFFGRLTRFVLSGYDYESASLVRRGAVRALHVLDFAVLGIAPLQSLGGLSVLYGRVPARAAEESESSAAAVA
jgi:2-polyprenyl-3-methyl-5-hydroxy-6-metoxy-1,4-benzoquinol methylase